MVIHIVERQNQIKNQTSLVHTYREVAFNSTDEKYKNTWPQVHGWVHELQGRYTISKTQQAGQIHPNIELYKWQPCYTKLYDEAYFCRLLVLSFFLHTDQMYSGAPGVLVNILHILEILEWTQWAEQIPKKKSLGCTFELERAAFKITGSSAWVRPCRSRTGVSALGSETIIRLEWQNKKP